MRNSFFVGSGQGCPRPRVHRFEPLKPQSGPDLLNRQGADALEKGSGLGIDFSAVVFIERLSDPLIGTPWHFSGGVFGQSVEQLVKMLGD